MVDDLYIYIIYIYLLIYIKHIINDDLEDEDNDDE